MATQIFVCLDTNILIRTATQGLPGCEFDFWLDLLERAKKSDFILLVPEVIELEFQKAERTFDKEFEASNRLVTAKLQELKSNPKFWNELTDLFPVLESKHTEWTATKVKETKQRFRQIAETIADSRTVTKIPLDHHIQLKAEKRVMSANFPPREEKPRAKSSQDCMIVESLLSFFAVPDGKELLFGTENLPDFGVQVEVDGRKTINLHTILKPGFPPTQLFISLKEVIEFLRTKPVVIEPPPEAIEKAVEETARETEELRRRVDTLSALIASEGLMKDVADAIIGGSSYSIKAGPGTFTLSSPGYLQRKLAELDNQQKAESLNSEMLEYIRTHPKAWQNLKKLLDEIGKEK